MNSRFRFAIALAISAGLLGHVGAQEWTRFRGPNGSGLGTAPNLPVEFSEKDFNWKIELPGGGNSSPVIWGTRVFVTCNPARTGKTVLLCLDAADRRILWQTERETNTFRKHADNSYASASPAVDAERVYFLTMAPEGSQLTAHDQKDGRELWKKELGPFVSQHGPGTSPIVQDGLVLLDFDPDEPQKWRSMQSPARSAGAGRTRAARSTLHRRRVSSRRSRAGRRW